ncbi:MULTISPECIES: hypothetical protein [unclassified Novosphingobium]|uniref:hypothetical protein n=1 Tax=unclassified Novosphingobium TaxID=2644732 RepID=UPI00086CAB67|nr:MULTISPECIES: hypothetical protein [unclassified Novosphingobium]MBN9146078.1 hypothetical protein [Novosphingobium sp.]MDR6709381.1 hypothetical protein [Novosphingobium sp. 1748]ODU80241.1 MAG: hypothetical protein ABT10_18545 [Novosphingobium sp. SCN 63-17]OJX94166.1 MAG: hypothetical protein BGP00_05655 [Novosphingobium sp. 63-713]
MTVATGLPQLKRRVDDYVWREPGIPIQRLRDILDTYFMKFENVAIVGGLVRDIARRGKVGFKSDIDLVIAADHTEVAELACKLHATPNRFGGYASRHPHWKIDFWALETTWAATQGYAHVHGVQDILNTTFFDCDAVCYEIKSRKLYAPNDYLTRLQQRILDINLLPNPSIEGNLLRAIRRVLTWGYHPGPRLRAFIDDHLTDERLSSIGSTEARLFTNIVVGAFNHSDDLKRILFSDSPKSEFNTAVGKQLMLPGFEDVS